MACPFSVFISLLNIVNIVFVYTAFFKRCNFLFNSSFFLKFLFFIFIKFDNLTEFRTIRNRRIILLFYLNHSYLLFSNFQISIFRFHIFF
jgi:hypothetical protein